MKLGKKILYKMPRDDYRGCVAGFCLALFALLIFASGIACTSIGGVNLRNDVGTTPTNYGLVGGGVAMILVSFPLAYGAFGCCCFAAAVNVWK